MSKMAFSRMKRTTNTKTFKNDVLQNDCTARNVLSNNPTFVAFVDRMRAAKRVFFVKKKFGAEIEIISLPETVDGTYKDSNIEVGSALYDAETEWLNCCLRDFLERKSRYASQWRFVFFTFVVLLVTTAFLWRFWPFWDFLIDVEAEGYFKVLGISSDAQPNEIKRAYREAVRRWHPDRNPNCESCHTQMLKIQHAHDVLLSRHSQRFELAERYKDQLNQLRLLVCFRLYDMSFCASQEIFYLLRGTIMTLFRDNAVIFLWPLQIVCRVLIMSLFTLYEMIYISGFNIAVIIQVFYYCVASAKISAEEREMAKMVKRSYFDMYKEAVIFSIVPIFFHLAQRYGQNGIINAFIGGTGELHESSLEFFLRMSLGVFYIFSHLYRMTPNLWDNIALRKCSIPLKYMGTPPKGVFYRRIFFTELGVIFDDLFTFACRVPSVYRLTVVFIHVIFLCQFAWFPWDPPVLISLGNKQKKSTLKREPEAKKFSQSDCESKFVASSQKELSPDELVLLKNLDNEFVSWLDIVHAKYKERMDAAAANYMRQNQGSLVRFDIAPTVNLEEVVFFCTQQDSFNLGNKKKVFFSVKDRLSSYLLGLQRGPFGCISSESSEKENLDGIIKKFFLVTGKNSSFTPSEIWRSKFAITKINSDNCGVISFWVMFITFLIFLLFLLFFIKFFPGTDYVKHTAGLSSFQQPLCDTWRNFFSVGHILKKSGTGLATFFWSYFVLC